MPVSTLDQISLSEKRLLAALAIAGGALPYSSLLKIHSVRADVFYSSIEKLSQKAFVTRVMDRVSLQITSSSVLRRVKRRRITQIANALLSHKGELVDLGYAKALYSIAKNAGRQRLCAAISLRVARRASRENRIDESMEWYWNAFCCKGSVPYRLVVKMIRHNLHHSEMRKVQKLLAYSRKRYGFSYSLASLYLDYYHRRGLMARAAGFCLRIVQVAVSRGHKRAELYFLIRKAGFYVQATRIDEGEGILRKMERSPVTLSRCNQGLLHHFLGLASFYRGRFSDATHEFRLAVRKPHPLRSSSLMNLGIVLARAGELGRAERVLQRCIRMFSGQEDADCLAHAYNNLGIVCKLVGKISEARANYFRSLHLAKASNNFKLLAAIFDSIAVSFAVEGRTSRAIYYGKKAVRYAGRLDSKAMTSHCLTNLSLQLGIRGKFQLGLRCLREAVSIRKELGLNVNLANTYENMGLIYLFSKQYKKAICFFQLSSGLFLESKQNVESHRLDLFLSLVLIPMREFDRVRKILDTGVTLKEGSFEKGLRDYVRGSLMLQAPTLDCPVIRESIYSAEAIFRKTPALFWLAKAHQLKAEYLMRTDHYERAVLSIQQAYDIFTRLGARHELFALAKGGAPMKIQKNVIDRMAEKLPQKILLMIRSILAEQNSERMVSKILTASLEFTEMERAVLVLKEEPMRIFRSVSLDEATIEEIRDISQSAAKLAADARKPFISMNAASDP
ncbi:MAG TPA: tetratricopeptide repeat protein, partial [Acidobacteriota bacterium]